MSRRDRWARRRARDAKRWITGDDLSRWVPRRVVASRAREPDPDIDVPHGISAPDKRRRTPQGEDLKTQVYITVTIDRRDLDWTPEQRDNLAVLVEGYHRHPDNPIHEAISAVAKRIERDDPDVAVLSHVIELGE